jgi:hypothetical protein
MAFSPSPRDKDDRSTLLRHAYDAVESAKWYGDWLTVDTATSVQLLRQQISDGERRIESQRIVVQSLQTSGYERLADEAEEFLAKLVALQSDYLEQLTRLSGQDDA